MTKITLLNYRPARVGIAGGIGGPPLLIGVGKGGACGIAVICADVG